MTIKDPQARLARWAIILQAYDFKITHKPGKEQSNVDAFNRPVFPPSVAKIPKCCCILSARMETPEDFLSPKTLDVWDDENLIYFLKHRIHKKGLSSKQVRRVNNLEKHYFWNNEQIFYKKSLDDVKSLIVPKLEKSYHSKRSLFGSFSIRINNGSLESGIFLEKYGGRCYKLHCPLYDMSKESKSSGTLSQSPCY